MTRWISALAALLCGLGLVPVAHAEDRHADRIHVGIGYQHVFIDGETMTADGDTVTIPDFEHRVIVLRAGYDLRPFFAIEAEVMTSVAETELAAGTPAGDIPFSARILRGLGVFGKVRHEIAEGVSMHARVGGAVMKIEASAFGVSTSDTGEGLAYGAGGEVRLSEWASLRVDWTQYREDGETADAVSLAAVTRF